jgi:ABC-type Fe3+-hydroxamate transport system substrate-binding protein
VALLGVLVGATDWCTHPPGLSVTRVGGTKNPSLSAVVALSPDLVLANEEENRADDIAALRAAGIEVDVTWVRTVDQGLAELRRVLGRLGAAPSWLDRAAEVWSAPYDGPRRSALIPIWRKPWMAVGSDTFAGDLLSRLGIDNVLAASPERYPRFAVEDVSCDVVVLPDEPYAFSASDGPGFFSAPSRLVSGRHLTWYGPSLVDARSVLMEQLW